MDFFKNADSTIWSERYRLAALSKDDIFRIGLFTGAFALMFVMFHFVGNTTDSDAKGRSAILWMISRWSDSSISMGNGNYSHGWLIFPVSAFIVWLNRNELIRAEKRSSKVGLAVIIFLIIRIGIQNYRIEGASMEPNFHNGEYLIVNKLAYRLGEYERGDVIVFKYPNDPSKDYIKRVIGLPGDTVEIRGGELFVNDKQIEEPYKHMPNVRDEPPTVVDAGHLYVMGDNRPASSDTRSWGQLGQNFVIGQAWLAIYPFDTAGLVKHQPIEVNSVMAQGP